MCVYVGPGVWELRANLSSRDKKHQVTHTSKAVPTPSHMMFVKLQQVNAKPVLTFIIPCKVYNYNCIRRE